MRISKLDYRNRILSAILAVLMLVSALPIQAFSTDVEAEDAQVNTAVSTETAAPVLKITVDGVETSRMELRSHEKIDIWADGAGADAQFQWQILHPERDDLWVNIYDATHSSISVTLALVGNMLNGENVAQLRCRATEGETALYSSPIVVQYCEEETGVPLTLEDYEAALDPIEEPTEATEELTEVTEEPTEVTEEPTEVTEEPTEATEESTEATEESTEATEGSVEAVADAPEIIEDSGESLLMADGEDSDFVTVTVEYIRYDYEPDENGNLVLDQEGTQAFTPYIATLYKGSNLTGTTVTFPTMIGYDTYLVVDGVDTEQSSLHFNLTDIQENVTYTVKYLPADVNYTIRYYLQNIYDDLYVEDTVAAAHLTGKTGAAPDAAAIKKEFSGFVSLYYQPDYIAADGSTVFEVYYERNYYLMEFDCAGGYGADTIYVRFGTYISVPNPVKSGWVFAGWNLVRSEESGSEVTFTDSTADTLPTTMPNYNSAYQAIWVKANTTYSVAYWILDSAGNCTFLGSSVREGLSGDDVSGSDDLGAKDNQGNQTTAICGQLAHVHGNSCYQCGDFAHSHVAGCYYCGMAAHEHTKDNCFDGMSLTWNDPDNGVNAIRDLEEGGDPESGYIYVIYSNDHGRYWPKLYLEDENGNGTYYVVNDTEGGYDEASFAALIDGEPLKSKTGTYGNETMTTTKYSPKTSCGGIQHIHENACLKCKAHTHTDNCYQDASSLEYVRADQNAIIDGDGSTVVNVYYQYKEYTLKFYYAASTGSGNNTKYWIIGGTSYYFGGQHTLGVDYSDFNNSTTNDMLDRVFDGGADRVGLTDNGVAPTLNTEGQRRVDVGIYTQGSEYVAAHGRTYYYISFTARYGDDISEKWPIDVFNSVTMAEGYTTTNGATGAWKTDRQATVSAWNGEHHVWYSRNISNETIKGKYQKLDYKLLYDPMFGDSTTVSYLCFWENGAQNNWNIPELYRYNIWVEAASSEIEDADTDNPVHVDGTTLVKKYNGVIYKRVDVYNTCDNSNTDEQTQPSLIGYTENGREGVSLTGASEVTDPETQYDSDIYDSGVNVHFYYLANKHGLKFWNHNDWLGDGRGAGNTEEETGVRYGTPLKNYGAYVNNTYMSQPANYPETLEPGAYVFSGWYTTALCLPGTEMDWANMSMPDDDLVVYAKWTPVTHKVYFYYLYDNIATKTYWTEPTDENGDRVTDAAGNPITLTYPIWAEHGALLGTAYNYKPEREGYTFIGWFYMDDQGKKRFAPDTMEITQELHLFAEWQSGIDTTYEVTYVLKEAATVNGVTYPAGTVIADPTTGHTTAGKTKTFASKAMGDLKAGFQTGFFPMVNSHSILMAEDSTQNTFEFEYVYDDKVLYKVRYVDSVTGIVMEETAPTETNKAIVTEKFKPFDGYIPQSYYIEKTLAADGNATEVIEANIITFYYTPDTEHGLYSIEYYLENVDSTDPTKAENYTKYESIVSSSDLLKDGKKVVITADIRTYEGYTHYSNLNTVITYNSDGTVKAEKVGTTQTGNPPSGEIEYTGLTIKVYYQRNKYPYIIEYRDSETGALLREVEQGSAKFDSIISHIAPAQYVDNRGTADTSDDITYDYYLADATEEQRTKTRTIRESTNGSENTLVFYYVQKKVEVQYHAVCLDPNVPEGVKFGVVSPNAELGTKFGSEATSADGFRFMGWYSDEACTVKVGDETYFIPDELHQDADWINHYYALFEPVKEDLTIHKTGEGLGTDTFLFRVTGTDVLGNSVDLIVSIQGAGSVTIKDLYCGTYTVTELTSWSWTYACADAEQEVTLSTKKDTVTNNEVTFSNSAADVEWLHGESAAAENQFGTP